MIDNSISKEKEDMQKRFWAIGISLFLLAFAHACDRKSTKPDVVVPDSTYLGQMPPGETPVIFAPDVLDSAGVWVEATALSPDGTQFFFAVGTANYSGAILYYSRLVNNVWTPVVEAPFTTDFTYSNEPVFSDDGATLTFTGQKETGSRDLWNVSFINEGWGVPTALPSPINSNRNEFRGSTMTNGTMYFCSNRSGMMQIYKAYTDTTQSLIAEMLGAPINTRSYEGDPCIATDGHFLIFYSCRGGSSSDLYVSFSDSSGGWETPIDLGAEFNTANDEYGAHLSSDGKYLFFTRHTAQGNSIYWVAASAIEKLKD